MKKLFVSSGLIAMLLSSCATQKMGTYTDDVYANPKEEKQEEARLAAIRQQQRDAENKRYNDSIAAVQQAQKEKDDANPYYKDREFKYDDYYDYEYATRIRRFDNGINGLSYYDNYYTNSYWYSNNPYNYGVSVYNGYSWWGQGYNSYNYSPQVTFYANMGWGSYSPYPYNGYYGYNPYDPYASAYWQGFNNGYNQGYNNGWYGYPYYGYGFGYGGGYPYYGGGWNNPYYNGWGYYNSYDLNSSYTYGPRASHGGGNSRRTTNPGLTNTTNDDYYNKYVSSVRDQQVRNVKFTEVKTPDGYSTPIKNGNNNGSTGGVKPVNGGNGNTGTPVRNGTRNVKETEVTNPAYTTPVKGGDNNNNNNNNGNTGGVKQQPTYQQPVRQQPVKQQPVETPTRYEAPVKQNNNYQTPNIPSNNGGGNNGGGNTTPSSGGHRPR